MMPFNPVGGGAMTLWKVCVLMKPWAMTLDSVLRVGIIVVRTGGGHYRGCGPTRVIFCINVTREALVRRVHLDVAVEIVTHHKNGSQFELCVVADAKTGMLTFFATDSP